MEICRLASISQSDVAEIVNLGERSIKRARKVLNHADDETIKSIERGELSLSARAFIVEYSSFEDIFDY